MADLTLPLFRPHSFHVPPSPYIPGACWRHCIPHEVPTPNLAHTLVSACRKRRNIRSYQLTTCYGLHQKTSFVSIRPHSLAHSGDSSIQRPTLPSWPSIRSFTWQGLDTSSWSSSRSLDRPTLQRHWICSCQHLEMGHPTGPWWSDCDATARVGYAMTTTTTMSRLFRLGLPSPTRNGPYFFYTLLQWMMEIIVKCIQTCQTLAEVYQNLSCHKASKSTVNLCPENTPISHQLISTNHGRKIASKKLAFLGFSKPKFQILVFKQFFDIFCPSCRLRYDDHIGWNT